MSKIKVGQVYENRVATFIVKEIKTSSFPYRCKVVYKNSQPDKTLDLEEEQLLKMKKVKG